MNRRLMHYLLDNYRADRKICELLNTTELWIVPVANPDGYDYTFEPGQRLWRKNLRDNDGDGGSPTPTASTSTATSTTSGATTTRAPRPTRRARPTAARGPNSEPETKALDALVQARRLRVLRQLPLGRAAAALRHRLAGRDAVARTTCIGEAMAGDDAHPAVPGYDPDISAELYTTNGDTDTYLTEKYGAFGFTPEMSTCEAASDSEPDDEWEAEDCGSGFEFPDDEALVEAEFRKNIPFALAVAESASDPDDPVSVVGREAEDFRADTFSVSYGDPQTVAVTAKRALKELRLNYRINNGKTKTVVGVRVARRRALRPREQALLRRVPRRGQGRPRRRPREGVVQPASARQATGHGDDVESAPFTYTVKQDTGAKVLVIADEDYTGVNPTYPPGTNAPRYAAAHLAAIRAAGYSADLWDTDKDGVPHDLGVLSHYKAVVWYLGRQPLHAGARGRVHRHGGRLRPARAARHRRRRARAVPDDGGARLPQRRRQAHQHGRAGAGRRPRSTSIVGGLYYGLNGDPTRRVRDHHRASRACSTTA